MTLLNRGFGGIRGGSASPPLARGGAKKREREGVIPDFRPRNGLIPPGPRAPNGPPTEGRAGRGRVLGGKGGGGLT